MPRSRFFLCLLTSALLLLAHLHIWDAPGCAMCGSSCRCASHASGASCSVRGVGCGGGDAGHAVGSVSPLRAVLLATASVEPGLEFSRVRTSAALLPPSPTRAPLERPPRVSC